MITGFSFITMVNSFVAAPPPFVAFTVNVKLPFTVGVPLMVSPVRVSPSGRLPSIVHVPGVTLSAASVWL